MYRKVALGATAIGFSVTLYAATNRPEGFTTLCKIGETCSNGSSTDVAFGAPSKKASTLLAEGQYSIVNRFSALAISVENASVSDGANILQGQPDSNAALWHLENLGNGYYSIRSATSNKSIDVYRFSLVPGGEIRQWSYWGGDNQQWDITPTDDGYYTITSKLNGLVLDAWEWSQADQSDIRQYTALGGTNQHWRFTLVDDSAPGNPQEPGEPQQPDEPQGPVGDAVRDPDLEGFGAATTGGAGGEVVYASTGTQINEAMCRRASDDTPLIIMVNGTIDHGNTSKVSGSCDTTGEEIQFKRVSNLSIIGDGNKGTLDQIGIHVREASNIIIQNLHIKNVKKSGSPTSNGGDAIGMEKNVNNIWIDHNTLEASGGESSGYDSLLDMKAGVTNVTVSYNWYRNSSRAGLIGSSDSDSANTNITFHHNWYQNIQQRTPLIRHALVHVYNNYWSNPSQDYMYHAINSRMGASALVEGNYFYNVNNPLLASDDSSQPGCWQTGENTVEPEIYYSRSVGDGALVVPDILNGQLQSNCRVSVPYRYQLDQSLAVPAIVRANAGVGKIN